MDRKLIICDVDNTLLFTDRLNNKSYIEAAKKIGVVLPKGLFDEPRITSKKIREQFRNLEMDVLKRLKEEKLKYFLSHLDEIIVNKKLLSEIQSQKPGSVCLWTSSLKERAVAECNYFDIQYDELIVFDKENVGIDEINKIINHLLGKYSVDSKKVLIIDDDSSFLGKVKKLGYATRIILPQR